MKTKLLFSYCVMLLAGALVFTSCANGGDQLSMPESALTFSSGALQFTAAGGDKTVDVTTKLTWTLSVREADKAWLSASVKDATITVTTPSRTVGVSDSYENRTGILVVKAGNLLKTITVMQFKLADPVISVTDADGVKVSTAHFVQPNDTMTLTVAENQGDCTFATSPDATSWLKTTFENGVLKIWSTVPYSAADATRTTTLTFSIADGYVTYPIRITQGTPEAWFASVPNFTASGSWIYKVQDPGNATKTIAWLVKEYVRTSSGTSIDGQCVVVYPCVADKPQFSKGVLVHQINGQTGTADLTGKGGGVMNFAKADNTLVYNAPAAEGAMEVAYFTAGLDISQASLADNVCGKLKTTPYNVYDMEDHEYGLVKIGTQVWTNKNLYCVTWADGSKMTFQRQGSVDPTFSKDNDKGPRAVDAVGTEAGDPVYGYAYNGWAMFYGNNMTIDYTKMINSVDAWPEADRNSKGATSLAGMIKGGQFRMIIMDQADYAVRGTTEPLNDAYAFPNSDFGKCFRFLGDNSGVAMAKMTKNDWNGITATNVTNFTLPWCGCTYFWGNGSCWYSGASDNGDGTFNDGGIATIWSGYAANAINVGDGAATTKVSLYNSGTGRGSCIRLLLDEAYYD